MHKYRVTSPTGLNLAVGAVVALSAAFVSPVREAAGGKIKPLPSRFEGKLKTVEGREGVYQVTMPITLKRGLEFGFEGDLPKVSVELVEDLEPKPLLPEGEGAGRGNGKKKGVVAKAVETLTGKGE